MIENESDKDFTVMIFRDTANPRVLRFSNELVKTWSWLIPSIFLILGVLAAGWVFYTKQSAKRSVSTIYENEISRLESQTGSASSEKEALNTKISELEERLLIQQKQFQELKSGNKVPYPLNPADFPVNANIRAVNFRSEVNAFGGLTLKFDLENTDRFRRTPIKGNLLSIAQNGANLSIYPANASSESELAIDPSKGDNFSFKSFRPSVVKFDNLRNPRRTINFRIFLYDDAGLPIFYTSWSGKAGP
jgi:hypothetical protein